jgi:NADH-quinone oxidoreductase subunit M
VLLPLLIFVVWIGVYPSTFLKPMEPSVKNFIQQVEKKKAAVLNVENAKKRSAADTGQISVAAFNHNSNSER